MTGQIFKIKQNRHARPFELQYAAVRHFVEEAERVEEGQFYNSMAALVFMASCAESYANHLGLKLKLGFGAKKDHKSVIDKYKCLAEKLSVSFVIDDSPFNVLRDLKHRNNILHGRDQFFSAEKIVSGEDLASSRAAYPVEEWEKFVEVSSIKELFCKLKLLFEIFHCKIYPYQFPLVEDVYGTAVITRVNQ